MKVISHGNIGLVCGGQAPIQAETAGEYFGLCMNATNPSASWGAGWAVAGFFSRTLGGAGAAWAAGTAMVCGIGTIQYAQ